MSGRDSFGKPILSKIGVSIGPGATALTRMPRGASSVAKVRASERIAAFVAPYTDEFRMPFVLAAEVLKMTEAPSERSGKKVFTVKYEPLKLTSAMLSKSASSVSGSGT
jgi:hypothetical protein